MEVPTPVAIALGGGCIGEFDFIRLFPCLLLLGMRFCKADTVGLDLVVEGEELDVWLWEDIFCKSSVVH